MAAVALVGTLDTKGPDFAFLAGRGSLAGLMPYGDANAIVVEMADEMLVPHMGLTTSGTTRQARSVPGTGWRSCSDRLMR